MTLILDIGNTAMKWRLRHSGGASQGGSMHSRDWPGVVSALADICSPDAVTAIWVASVAGRQADAEIAGLLRQAFGAEPVFYYSQASVAGVSNAYAEPRRLGVDRWLALVETWHRCGASIVVDCGSALTIDAVNAAGQHLGGYIVPGLEMLRESLAVGTAEVQVGERDTLALVPGRSTAEGVRNGIMRMTVAFIVDAVVELRQALSDTCRVFITGGDARKIASVLDMDADVAPDLVLDGLERVMALGNHGG
jgi:type III pantothenate kinase